MMVVTVPYHLDLFKKNVRCGMVVHFVLVSYTCKLDVQDCGNALEALSYCVFAHLHSYNSVDFYTLNEIKSAQNYSVYPSVYYYYDADSYFINYVHISYLRNVMITVLTDNEPHTAINQAIRNLVLITKGV